MTDIDFGTLVSAVIGEMNCTASELYGDDLTDREAALEHYKRNVIGAIRKVFDEADAPAPVVPTCKSCGAPLYPDAICCTRCGLPLTPEAADRRLTDLLAEVFVRDASMSPDEPRLQGAIARIREENPESWAALVEKMWPATKA